MVTDPIADLLIRLKNGWLARRKSVIVPYSKMNIAILKIMLDVGILSDLRVLSVENKPFKIIKVLLKYDENKKPIIMNLKRVSKPGRRIYRGYRELKPVNNGYGFAIISTSRGIMTDFEARKRKLGGEVLCEIY